MVSGGCGGKRDLRGWSQIMESFLGDEIGKVDGSEQGKDGSDLCYSLKVTFRMLCGNCRGTKDKQGDHVGGQCNT